MMKAIGEAKRIFYCFRTEQGVRKVVPIRGLYVSQIKDDGEVGLNAVVQNNNSNESNNDETR